ncbi:MAG: hypothetical protein ACK5Q5_18735, partial [Planctomycetaceae bacterium]
MGRTRQTVRVLTHLGSPEQIEANGATQLSHGNTCTAMSDLFVSAAARVGNEVADRSSVTADG